MSLLLTVDKESEIPLFKQIVDEIVALADAGTLKPGDRLPSSRGLADRIGVNRTTVYKAYQELWALGYTESTPGSYSVIRKRRKVVTDKEQPSPSFIDWSRSVSQGFESMWQAWTREAAVTTAQLRKTEVNFVNLSPDTRIFPAEDFRKCMNHVLAFQGPELLQYGDPQGYLPLRESIADRMRQHGVRVNAEEILITVGAQNGIELTIRLLADRDSTGAFEAPTYARALSLFRVQGIKPLAVPMTAHGMDIDVLETGIRTSRPSFIYTMPNFQNPTGITTEQSHRERLLKVCETHGIPLVEDGFEEEMKYFGKAVLPIKSMDRHGAVIYLGTFSKILFPGIRIGWIAADKECIARLTQLQRITLLSGSGVDQAALDRFCRIGLYDLHVKRMHREYKKRMQTALNVMNRVMPRELAQWHEPSGGYTIWVTLKKPAALEKELMTFLYNKGIAVSPGLLHYYDEPPGLCFRLSIAHMDEEAVETGFTKLAKGIEQFFMKERKP